MAIILAAGGATGWATYLRELGGWLRARTRSDTLTVLVLACLAVWLANRVLEAPRILTLVCVVSAWDAPLPCTPYPQQGLSLLAPGDLSGGFWLEP